MPLSAQGTAPEHFEVQWSSRTCLSDCVFSELNILINTEQAEQVKLCQRITSTVKYIHTVYNISVYVHTKFSESFM